MSVALSDAKLHSQDYLRILKTRFGLIFLSFLLIFLTAVVITYIKKPEYAAKAIIQIQTSDPDINPFMPTQRMDATTMTPLQMLQTEFQLITGKEVLNRVVEKLDLVNRWHLPTKTDAYNMLKSRITADSVRLTELVDIKATTFEPDEAALIANEVAVAYLQRRMELDSTKSSRALKVLDEMLADQKKKVDVARLQMLDLAQRYGITIDMNSSGRSAANGGEVITPKETLITDNLKELEKIKTQISLATGKLEMVKTVPLDKLIESSELAKESSIIQVLQPKYLELKSTVPGLADSGYGRLHPKRLSAEKQLAEIKNQLTDAILGFRKAEESNLGVLRKTMADAESNMQKKEDDILDQKSRNSEYVDAKLKWEVENSLFTSQQTSIAMERRQHQVTRTPIIIHEKAEPNYRPVKPNVMLNLALGGILGLGLGLGLALFLEYMDTSVKSIEDVERYIQHPVLAVIPQNVGMLHKQSGLSPDAEAYRILRTNIEFNRKSATKNAISVVSGGAGEGKSTTLMNLAYVCAQGGYNTLIIDADLRRPRMHTFFDINNSIGLTNYLTTDIALEDVVLRTPIDNLYFMPSGILPADAAGILNSQRMSDLIADVKSRFDLVLVDSPPILGVSDASVIASEVDFTMIVVQHRKLPREMLFRVKQAVENVGGNILGVVLNNVNIKTDNQYSYYTSYYTYYAPQNQVTRGKVSLPSMNGKSEAQLEEENAKTTAKLEA